MTVSRDQRERAVVVAWPNDDALPLVAANRRSRHTPRRSSPAAAVTAFLGRDTPLRSVTAADAARVPDACPDDRWRLIFSLARWGGLRVPSELTPLTWGDVDWDAGKLRVTSPKTAHHPGKGERVIPLFPELRASLEPLRDPAAPPSAPLLTGGLTAPHLRRDFLKVLGRAGLDPWPKLFHNLRASRQTELSATFPVHVVCDWIGNTAAVAAEHYLTTTAEDFERAAFSERIDVHPGSESDVDRNGPERTQSDDPAGGQGRKSRPVSSGHGRSSE